MSKLPALLLGEFDFLLLEVESQDTSRPEARVLLCHCHRHHQHHLHALQPLDQRLSHSQSLHASEPAAEV